MYFALNLSTLCQMTSLSQSQFLKCSRFCPMAWSWR